MLVSYLAFAGAAALIVLLPGPDTLVVVRSILRGGRRQGILTALGNLVGLTVWVSAAVLGLAALLKASEIGYDALRVVGACYLVYLGVQAWRTRGAIEAEVADGSGKALLGTGFRAGILTNLFNPKVGVFFVTFLPGFVPDGAPVTLTTAAFGGIFVLLTALYWLALLGVAEKVRTWMSTPTIRRRMDVATAGILVAFGVRLATE
ncbi:threonine/homoserine/homoserine lactone efflux protein [Marmoricola sp. OAE513]|uniref:LysE family translocator n=1 Tax=Marmoricola sp. OAE513 TaxID=2817894 RepID=UPI001AE2056D